LVIESSIINSSSVNPREKYTLLKRKKVRLTGLLRKSSVDPKIRFTVDSQNISKQSNRIKL